ncbi:HAD family hydrolase [Sphingobium sp. AN558]|uniref:HAD family hydrolase n=1 Tax=Sphingobium sp. AN558 TaxID=3133442 RepID=UPI0030BF447A
MTRPLIVTDCDEVLLHMVVPFRDWLDDVHGVHFDFRMQGFGDALRHKDSGQPVERALVWKLLVAFFDSEMHRQSPIAGAIEAMHRLAAIADIVVLTNIGEEHAQGRVEQLASHGLHVPVFWNRGGKGPQLARIVAERSPGVTLFIDDIAENHDSVAEHAPSVWRLHLVGEPEIAANVPPCPAAHARIDDWALAERWIVERLAQGPAPVDPAPIRSSQTDGAPA